MTPDTLSQSSLPRRRVSDWRARAAAALAIAIMTTGAAHADVRVSGGPRALQVEATRSNVAEVLSALETACGLRVKTSTALDRPVGGTFTGSLAQTLSRLLQGYNYFIRQQASDVEVTIIGLEADRATAAEIARPRPPPTPAMSLSQAVRLKSH